MKSGEQTDGVEVRVRQAARLMALGALRAAAKHEEPRRKQEVDGDSERESRRVYADSRVHADMTQSS